MIKIIPLLLSLSVCSLVWAQPQWSQAQQEVVDAIEGYLAAWNSFDAIKLASFCDAECDRIDARGNVYHGREEILRHYTKVFATPPPEGVERKLTYDIFSVRIVTPDVAVVDARYTVKGVGPRPSLTIKGMNTVVLTKKEGRWLRVAHRQRIPSSIPRLEANKEIIRRFNDAVNNKEFNLLNDLVVANFVRHSQATPNIQVGNRDEFIRLQKEFLKTFPDQRVTIEKMVAEGDYVAVYATYRGTQEGPMPPFPASGKKAESKFLGLFRLQEGKIAELWVEWDNLDFLKQLGHFPPPAMSEN